MLERESEREGDDCIIYTVHLSQGMTPWQAKSNSKHFQAANCKDKVENSHVVQEQRLSTKQAYRTQSSTGAYTAVEVAAKRAHSHATCPQERERERF